jgi:hypothetical protein
MHEEIMAITFVCIERFFASSFSLLFASRAKEAFAEDGTDAANIFNWLEQLWIIEDLVTIYSNLCIIVVPLVGPSDYPNGSADQRAFKL